MSLTSTTDPATASPALHVHREGAGEPLVLLHGMGESHIGWRPVIGALAEHYDVIAIDLPGFGRSPALPATVTPTAAALGAAVQQTLDDRGIGSYHVAGYSLGARVALQLAHSERVLSVIAIGPDGLGTPLERFGGYLWLATGREIAKTLAPMAEVLSWTAVGRSMFFAGNRSLPWQLRPVDHRQLLTDYAASPAYDVTNLTAMFEASNDLTGITAPTLFLQGTADPLTAQVLRYLACIPHARIRFLPGMNHVPISDNPAGVAGQMLSFLGQAARS